jgi:hypothetical protein
MNAMDPVSASGGTRASGGPDGERNVYRKAPDAHAEGPEAMGRQEERFLRGRQCQPSRS